MNSTRRAGRFSLDFSTSGDMTKGEIVLGCLAPHPPHVVYAENPDRTRLSQKEDGRHSDGVTTGSQGN